MTKFSRILFLTILSISASTFGQYVKVTKILDANLFELEDGSKIKLAGVDAPQLDYQIPLLSNIAEQAVSYCTSNILDRKVFIEPVAKSEKLAYQLVHLKINYLFNKSYFNESYLMKGFGKFIDNVDSSSRNKLIDAQLHAAKNKEGIWSFFTPTATDTLDAGLTLTGIHQLIQIDSSNASVKHSSRPIYFAVPLELMAGTALTLVGSYGSALLILAITKPRGEFAGFGAAVGGFALGYSLGFPLGVYLVAKSDNPHLSFLATVGSSFAMALVTSGISYGLFPKDGNHPTRFILLLSPIIGPLLYVHLFPPAYPTQDDLTTRTESVSKAGDFQNYYNSTMKFRMELFRINF